MNKAAEMLLREALADIEDLRRQNELMAAKLEGVEMMAMAVSSRLPSGPSTGMKECVVHKIRRYLEKC